MEKIIKNNIFANFGKLEYQINYEDSENHCRESLGTILKAQNVLKCGEE